MLSFALVLRNWVGKFSHRKFPDHRFTRSIIPLRMRVVSKRAKLGNPFNANFYNPNLIGCLERESYFTWLWLVRYCKCESVASALKHSVNSRKNTWMEWKVFWISRLFLLNFRIFCDHGCGFYVYYGVWELLYDKRTSQRTNSSFTMVRISSTTVTPRLSGWRRSKFIVSCYSGWPTRGLSFC